MQVKSDKRKKNYKTKTKQNKTKQQKNKNKNKKTREKKKNINWEESSRLKANSKVDTSGPFFVFLSLLFRFLFFFLE